MKHDGYFEMKYVNCWLVMWDNYFQILTTRDGLCLSLCYLHLLIPISHICPSHMDLIYRERLMSQARNHTGSEGKD